MVAMVAHPKDRRKNALVLVTQARAAPKFALDPMEREDMGVEAGTEFTSGKFTEKVTSKYVVRREVKLSKAERERRAQEAARRSARSTSPRPPPPANGTRLPADS